MSDGAVEPRASRHAIERARERAKLPKRAIAKLVRDAWFKGRTVDQLGGDLRHWVDWKSRRRPDDGLEVRVYQRQLFIFGDQCTCITILSIPREVMD